ncbi:MAG: MFS transporter [Microscillaceae bacterium]|jgi:MFS family permease|nr:MFS transporter [Microscillaceae bacterium]
MKNQTPAPQRKNIWLLGWISLFTDISSQMIYPLLPNFLLDLGANKKTIGLIEGLAEAGGAIFKVFSGAWSDKWRKRKLFIFLGYGLSTISRPILYVATTWGSVLGVKLLDRLGKATRTPARDALIADSAAQNKKGRDFGIHRAMDRLGSLLGPLLALWILSATMGQVRQVFLYALIPAILALFFIPFLQENNSQSIDNQAISSHTEKIKNPAFWWFIGAFTLFTLGNSSNAFLLLKAQEVGIEWFMMPLLWAIYNLVCAISSPILGRLSDYVGRKSVLAVSFLYYALIYLGFAYFDSIEAIWILFGLFGVHYGLSEGVSKAYIADLVGSSQRGRAYGILDSASGLALLPASLLMGAIWDAWGSQWAFLVSAGFSLLGLVVFVANWRK